MRSPQRPSGARVGAITDLRAGGIVYMAIGAVLLFSAWQPNSMLGRLLVRPPSTQTLGRYWNGVLGVVLVVLGVVFFVLG